MERGFKTKTISKIIKYKMNHWCRRIKAQLKKEEKSEEEITEFINNIKKHVIVTGGCITSMLLGEHPNDFDVYFSDSHTCGMLAEFYVRKYKPTNARICDLSVIVEEDRVRVKIPSVGALGGEDEDGGTNEYEYFEQTSGDEAADYLEKHFIKETEGKELYKVLMITENAITLSGRVQIITRFVGDPTEIHTNFDFVHTTNYWTYSGGLVINLPALQTTIARELIYIGSKYPICSLFRIRKFINRGWTISAGQIFKIGYDVNKLDLDDIEILHDQLTGVDAAYFHEVIEILRRAQDRGKTIDRTYLFELIGRIFDDI